MSAAGPPQGANCPGARSAEGRSTGGRRKSAIIIGAGPAGLTAALELARRTDVHPLVLEASDTVGGISRTVLWNGHRMDIGGHRFFSKSDWVMAWWQQILPLERPDESAPVTLTYRNQRRDWSPQTAPAVDPERVMLVRDRLSRIYFLGKFFAYPVKLDLTTLRQLGPWRVAKAGAGYVRAALFPRHPERSLEDFLINRFGNELYRTFFKEYTEKVWGVACSQISAEWGAQRIKGLSLTQAVLHALRRSVASGNTVTRETRTSLVERFLYPKYGPGQLWTEVARQVGERGGELRLSQRVETIVREGERVVAVKSRDVASGAVTTIPADYVLSTMPVSELIASITPAPPESVCRVAAALPYRDFIVVGVLAERMRGASVRRSAEGALVLPDSWIYVQDPDVRLGRVQIFNNWSPALVADPTKAWLGLEYFCDQHDALWRSPDAAIEAIARAEITRIGLVDANDVIAMTVVRVPKAYPAYFGAYAEFATIRAYVDPIANLYLIGRNGMHRYNNQDHSMLTAKAAVDNIAAGREEKESLWAINVDDDYHEQRDNDASQ